MDAPSISQPAKTYIYHLSVDTGCCLQNLLIGIDGKRDSIESMLQAHPDDDDDDDDEDKPEITTFDDIDAFKKTVLKIPLCQNWALIKFWN